jgi:lipoate-protein ligase A
MFSIINNSKNIYFNLALEEYLLRNYSEDFFTVWQSDKAVVAGKHQNLMAEVNHSFIRKNNIPLARRISGGGTVFHGPGNLNFTFIKNGEQGKLVNFNYFVTPIISFLDTLGIVADIGRHNDLLIDGKKISGNAEHVFKNRVLHHGTLLFDADLNWLNESIKVKPGRYIDKAVQSSRWDVCNISEYLISKMPIDVFASELNQYLMKCFPEAISYELSATELAEVNGLMKKKYATPEWIFGYSPPFEFRSRFFLSEKEVQVEMKVIKGKIEEISFKGNMEYNRLLIISEKFKGIEFTYESLLDALLEAGAEKSLKRNLLEAIF